MVRQLDWQDLRKNRLSSERPDYWPDGVYAISTSGLTLLGVHEKEHKLFWDGEEIVTRNVIRLGRHELIFAAVASLSALGIFLLEIYKTFCAAQ